MSEEERVPQLRIESLVAGYGGEPVLHGIDAEIPKSRMTAIVGPNGCGKSTLLRAAGRLLKPTSGAVTLDGHPVGELPTRELAQRLGLLPQTPLAPEGISVADLVARGRAPHQRWWEQWSREDSDAVERALERCELVGLRDRPIDQLSGGQQQRAWIALALAQDPRILLLDEPTSHLDLSHQIELLELLRRLCDEGGSTVVVVLHDLNLASRFADHLLAMRDGRVVRSGSPAEVVDEDTIADVFGLRVKVIADPVSGSPLVIPLTTITTEKMES